jgi:alpha-mannosidase
LEFTPGGDWIENKLADKAFARILNPWADRTRAHLRQLARGEIQTDRTDVWVVANKPARRGKGRILRLYTLAAPHQGVALSSARQEIKEAYLCDARERDIQPLETDGGTVHVTLSGTITTIRLIGAT